MEVPRSVEEALSYLVPHEVESDVNLLGPLMQDWISAQAMCTEHRQERKELIQALHKDRKLSNLPKITQPVLLIWGDHDQVFPL